MSRCNLSHNSTTSYASDRAWPWVALLLSFALFGLVHDLEYATAWGNDSAEAGRYFDRQADFQSDVNNVGAQRKIGFACLLLVGIYCVVSKPRGNRFQWHVMSLLIGIGLLWTLASVLWSVQPMQTARELVRLFSYLFVAAALALRFDPRSLCLLLVTTLMISVGTSVGVEIVTGGLRPWVPDYRLSGSMHSAAMGYYSMLIMLASYVLAQQTRSKFWWCVFISAAGVLILSKALTSLIAGAAGIAAYHLVGKSKEKLVFGACCAASFIAVVLLVTCSIDFWSAFRSGHVDSLGRDFDFTSFNGRIPLWTILIDKLQGHWIEGFGYGGFWVTRHIDSLHDELTWYPHHAHSAYLGTVVHVGLVGLALLLASAVMALRRTIGSARTLGSPEYYVFAAWLAAAFVISIAETSFVEPRDMGLLGAAIVFSCITAHHPARVIATVGQPVVRVAVPVRGTHGTSPGGSFA